MTAYEQFTAAVALGVELSAPEVARVEAICERVRGYSDGKQYAFFRELLALPDVHDVLVLGVYHGRDIAFMRDCLLEANRTDVRIVGVDKFSDTPCADWPPGSAGKGWQEAGFGPPPSLEQAMRNCGADTSCPVTLIESDDAQFLTNTPFKFDAAYLDTSHDEKTVARQIAQLRAVLNPDAIICGDDYSDTSNVGGGNWGVKSAVTAAFTSHLIFADWIWVSSMSLLKPL